MRLDLHDATLARTWSTTLDLQGSALKDILKRTRALEYLPDASSVARALHNWIGIIRALNFCSLLALSWSLGPLHYHLLVISGSFIVRRPLIAALAAIHRRDFLGWNGWDVAQVTFILG